MAVSRQDNRMSTCSFCRLTKCDKSVRAEGKLSRAAGNGEPATTHASRRPGVRAAASLSFGHRWPSNSHQGRLTPPGTPLQSQAALRASGLPCTCPSSSSSFSHPFPPPTPSLPPPAPPPAPAPPPEPGSLGQHPFPCDPGSYRRHLGYGVNSK